MTPRFEYDIRKSQANRLKHGIDFLTAQELWLDSYLCIQAARSTTETGYQAIAKIKLEYWSAFYTIRGSTIRLISVREARLNEVAHYEQKKQDAESKR